MHCMVVLMQYIGGACAYAYDHKHCMFPLVVRRLPCVKMSKDEMLCLDVPKAFKTVISCEALYQECSTLHKRPSFGHLQQLQPQSFDRAQICEILQGMWSA
jgi:hypothetical protein